MWVYYSLNSLAMFTAMSLNAKELPESEKLWNNFKKYLKYHYKVRIFLGQPDKGLIAKSSNSNEVLSTWYSFEAHAVERESGKFADLHFPLDEVVWGDVVYGSHAE